MILKLVFVILLLSLGIGSTLYFYYRLTFKPLAVVPHYNISEEPCSIYQPNGEHLCECGNELMFLDILCQIARSHYEGYYVIKNSIKYKINSDGKVDTKDKPPLFTKYDEYMKELMGF